MKISELSISDIKNYCGVSGNDSDTILDLLKDSAVSYITGYTALTLTELDEIPEMTHAALTLINENFYNRMYTVDSTSINPFVENVLSMHRRNLL